MLDTYLPDPQVIAAFRTRQRRHILMGIAWLAYGIAVLWTGWVPESQFLTWLVSGLVVFAILGLLNWRCPKCGTGLGKAISPFACPKCHTPFKDPT